MAVTEVKVPDVGTDKPIDVIEISVKPGDAVVAEQTLIVLESDKATVEVPSPVAGIVKSIALKTGDKVTQGALILVVETGAAVVSEDISPEKIAAEKVAAPVAAGALAVSVPAAQESDASQAAAPVPAAAVPALATPTPSPVASAANVHAGPAVRKLARELGVALAEVAGTGPRARILKDDVHAHVKMLLLQRGTRSAGSGRSLPELPIIDFAKWGPIEEQALNKLRRVSAVNLHRAWLAIPHVTQFDEADITALEEFRIGENARLKDDGVKLTMLAFIARACVGALKKYPKFNSSLAPNGEKLIVKNHWHIGIAVETPDGLVVPVIRDADRKGIVEIAGEMAALGKKAREKKLMPADMAGATFSISSLGGIGGTAFTPIVNWPEVAILGVSKSQLKPVWDGKTFQPRLTLPLSLSYDHRVIDGADAARFTAYLAGLLSDLRRLSL